MSDLTVSVAMAVYNGEKFIRPQLDSIMSQLGPLDEVVISYDKSSDRTWSIINDYAEADSRVRVICDPGCGVFSNFENAVANCRDVQMDCISIIR